MDNNNENEKECYMQKTKSYMRKELREITEAPGYLINYLKDCGRLPIIRESQGKGYPTLYHPDSIQIIKDHLTRRAQVNE